MIRSTHAMVDVNEGVPKRAVLAALESLGVSWTARKRTADENTKSVWIGDSDSTSNYDIRVWTNGRTREASNPFADRTVRHVLGCDPELDPSVLGTTMGQIVSRASIDFHKVLGENAQTYEVSFSKSAEKNAIVEKVADFLGDAGCSQRLIRVMQTTVDEMVTNAIYNAPLEEGRRLFAARSRTEGVESPKAVTLRVGVDGENVTVLVRDEYGSLSPGEVVDNLFRCYRFEQAQVEDKAGGAGLGFFLLLRNATRFVVNIDPGKFTEMMVQRNRNQRFKAFSKSSPSLNLCVVGATDAGLRRVSRRYPVRWEVQAVMPDGSEQTVVLRDISRHGAFVTPKEGELGLESGQEMVVKLPDFAELNESQVQLGAQDIRAVVRWVGENRHHRCEGAGLKFDRELDVDELR